MFYAAIIHLMKCNHLHSTLPDLVVFPDKQILDTLQWIILLKGPSDHGLKNEACSTAKQSFNLLCSAWPLISSSFQILKKTFHVSNADPP